jgi:serralysin
MPATYGTNAPDTLDGGVGNDLLHGGDGDDHVDGSYGNDALHGDGGDDSIDGAIGHDLLQGGAGDDTLFGNIGADTLAGGAGADLLIGSDGHDKFDFVTAPVAGEVDSIDGFNPDFDLIRLSLAAFDVLPLGKLRPYAFVEGTVAADPNDRILYDQATGALRYDADGSGAAAAVQFATVTPGTVLTAQDTLVF